MVSNDPKQKKSWRRPPFLRLIGKRIYMILLLGGLIFVLCMAGQEWNEMLKQDLINEESASAAEGKNEDGLGTAPADGQIGSQTDIWAGETKFETLVPESYAYPRHKIENLVTIPKEKYTVRSAWMEDDEVYVLLGQPDGRPMDMQIRKVEDGSITMEMTKYSKPMSACIKNALMKSPGRNYTYEACLGYDGDLYLLGRDNQNYLKRLYALNENGYRNIPVLADLKDSDLLSLSVNRNGILYISDPAGMYVYNQEKRTYLAYNSASATKEYHNMALGTQMLYQVMRSRIYIWNVEGDDYAFDNWIRSDIISSAENVACADEANNLYIANNRGISFLPYGGTLWETIIDDSYMGFDTAVYELQQMWVNDNECYIWSNNKESGEQTIVCYTLE